MSTSGQGSSLTLAQVQSDLKFQIGSAPKPLDPIKPNCPDHVTKLDARPIYVKPLKISSIPKPTGR